jgi:hypothetical protein
MIEAITWIDFVPVWLHSLFHSSQIVSNIYKQLLCWKSRSTYSVIFSIWIRVKLCYSIYTTKVIIFFAKQNIQWWDEWLVHSQMILFVITSISKSKIIRALCNGMFFHSRPIHPLSTLPVAYGNFTPIVCWPRAQFAPMLYWPPFWKLTLPHVWKIEPPWYFDPLNI